MATIPQKLAALDAWNSAYQALESRAERIAARLIPFPACYMPTPPHGAIPIYDAARGAVLTDRRIMAGVILHRMTRRPEFRAITARYNAAFGVAA